MTVRRAFGFVPSTTARLRRPGSAGSHRRGRWAVALVSALLVSSLVPTVVSAAVYSLSGTVTNAVGVGVGGILVAPCPLVPAPGQQYIQCLPGATTASDGTYTVANVPPGTYNVSFSDPTHTYPFAYYSDTGFTMSYSASTNVVVSSSDVTGIDLRYPASYQITGTITGPDGSPVAGVQVFAQSQEGNGGFVNGGDEVGTSTADGTYSIAVTTGTYTVEAVDSSDTFVPTYYSTAGTGGAAITPVSAARLDVNANVSGINIQFAPARHISGTVRAAVGGQWQFMNIFACSTGVTPGTCYFGGTQADGTFRIAVPTGTYLLSFVDFVGGVLSGYWSSHGLVATSARATKLDVTAADVSAITASTSPIGVSAHAGKTRTGTFSTKLVSVRRGSPVTVRFAMGKGFAGATVSIWTAVAGSTGKLGSFRRTTSSVVRSDGYVFYTVPVKGLMAFRAQYLATGGIAWGSVSMTSASVKAKGS